MSAAIAAAATCSAHARAAAQPRSASRPSAQPAASRQQHAARQRRPTRLAAFDSDLTQEELEEQMDAFMRRQAEIESGAAARKAEPGKVLGADEVSEEEAKRMCREVVGVLKRLKEQRDMSLNEVRLTVAIEDPRARERRLMGMEDSSGISRDEMAAALMEVSEGRVPADRIALRELCREISAWPALDETARPQRRAAPAPEETAAALKPSAEDAGTPWRPKGAEPGAGGAGRGAREAAKSLTDSLPDWVGYGALYLVSIAPVLIAVAAISVLFFNSLR